MQNDEQEYPKADSSIFKSVTLNDIPSEPKDTEVADKSLFSKVQLNEDQIDTIVNNKEEELSNKTNLETPDNKEVQEESSPYTSFERKNDDTAFVKIPNEEIGLKKPTIKENEPFYKPSVDISHTQGTWYNDHFNNEPLIYDPNSKNDTNDQNSAFVENSINNEIKEDTTKENTALQSEQNTNFVNSGNFQNNANENNTNTANISDNETTLENKEAEKVIQDEKITNQDELSYKEENNDVNISAINDKETVPATIQCVLYIRQLLASFFVHSNLGTLFPRIGMRLGPSYPSSFGISFILIGFVSAFCAVITSKYVEVHASGSISCVTYVILAGLNSFRGLAHLTEKITKRRGDLMISVSAMTLPCIIYIWIVTPLVSIYPNKEFIIIFTLLAFIAGNLAATICYEIRQDPVSSIGTMRLPGFVFAIIITVAPLYLLLNWQLATILLGVSIFIRVLLGYTYWKLRDTSSRENISCINFLIFLALLLTVLILKDPNPILVY